MMQPDTLLKESGDIQKSSPHTSRIGSARKGFAINVSSNVVAMVVQAAVSLWLTPYLIRYLGIAAYGMVPLVNSMTAYLEIFTSGFNSAVSRFLTIDLERGDTLTANKTFNTALFGVIGVVIALSPVVLATSLMFPRVFDIPLGWEKDASWLFIFVAVSFFISVIASNFAVSSFVHSKFLLRNLVNLAMLLVRISFIVTLFSLFPAHLWHIGVGFLMATTIFSLGHYRLWRKLTPELSVLITAFDRSRLRSLMGLGGWVVVNRVGGLLLKRVDLFVVNAVFGAAMTGAYGAVLQFSILTQSLADTATTVLRPVIFRKYGQGDFVGLKPLTSQAVKLLGLTLALPVGLLCGFSQPLLSIWLGPSFEALNVLLIVIVAHLGFNLSTLPLAYVQTAYNKVRWPGIITLFSGGANLGLAILLANWGGWGVAGVAIAGAIVWTAKNTLYTPIYAAHIMKLPWWTFLPSLSASVIGTFSVGIIAYGLTLVRMPNSWLALTSSAAVVSLLYVVGVGVIGLNRADWRLLKDLLPWRVR